VTVHGADGRHLAPPFNDMMRTEGGVLPTQPNRVLRTASGRMSASRALHLLPGRAPARSRDDSTVPPIPIEFQDGLAFAIVDENVEPFSDLDVNPGTRPGLRAAAELNAILLVGILEITVDAQDRLPGTEWASGKIDGRVPTRAGGHAWGTRL